ncbi:hypothetical protein CH063_00038 [Colletotrichum higginsianum]|nr:hypothetical protein CH063_00038 [Colletotrichum higginsianum]
MDVDKVLSELKVGQDSGAAKKVWHGPEPVPAEEQTRFYQWQQQWLTDYKASRQQDRAP